MQTPSQLARAGGLKRTGRTSLVDFTKVGARGLRNAPAPPISPEESPMRRQAKLQGDISPRKRDKRRARAAAEPTEEERQRVLDAQLGQAPDSASQDDQIAPEPEARGKKSSRKSRVIIATGGPATTQGPPQGTESSGTMKRKPGRRPKRASKNRESEVAPDKRRKTRDGESSSTPQQRQPEQEEMPREPPRRSRAAAKHVEHASRENASEAQQAPLRSGGRRVTRGSANEDTDREQDGGECNNEAHAAEEAEDMVLEVEGEDLPAVPISHNRGSEGRAHSQRVSAQTDADEEARQKRRLYGAFNNLHEIYKSYKAHKRGNHSSMGNVRIADLANRCRTLAMKLKRSTSPGDITPGFDAGRKISATLSLIRSACGLDKNNRVDYGDDDYGHDVFEVLVPACVRLIWSLVHFFERMDAGEAGDGIISLDQLSVVQNTVNSVVQSAQHAYDKFGANASHPVKSQCKRTFIIPLRDLSNQLKATHRRELAARQAREEADALERECAERRAAQAEMVRVKTIERAVHEKWAALCLERLQVEGFCKGQKRRYLDPHDELVDIDANHTAFLHIETYESRLTGELTPVERAIETAAVWTMAEHEALKEGLRIDADAEDVPFNQSRVYGKIVWKYCRPGGQLHRFNVFDLVVTAARLKSWLVHRCIEQGREPEPWVRRIPEWYRPALTEEVDGSIQQPIELS